MSDHRKFLHDLSSPLGAAILLADSLRDYLKGLPGIDPSHTADADKLNDVLARTQKLIQERREILIQRGEPPSSG